MNELQLQQALNDYNKARIEKIQQWSESHDAITVGCSQCSITPYCCYQMVMTPIMEGVVIAQYAKEECPDRMAKVIAQGKTQAYLLAQRLGKTPAELVVGTSQEELEQYQDLFDDAAHAWYNMSEPCGFLDGHNQCSIYSRRPTMCAAYYACDTCTRKIGTHEEVAVWDHREIVGLTLQVSMLAVMDLFGIDGEDTRYFLPMPLGAAVALADEVLLPHVR